MTTPRAAEHRDLEQRLRNLEADLRKLATVVSRRPQFEVSDGDLTIRGGALVVDGGDFLLLDTDGSTVFRLGPQQFGDRGVSLYREDGTLALGVRKALEGSTDQTLHIHDRFDNLLLSESVFGSGFDHPRLTIPMQPCSAASAPVTAGPYGLEPPPVTSTGFVPTHRATFPRYNLFSDWSIRVKASDTTTAGEVWIVDPDRSHVLAPFFASPWTGVRAAGTTTYDLVEPPSGLVMPGDVGEPLTLEVWVRRTAGTGSLTVAVERAQGG